MKVLVMISSLNADVKKLIPNFNLQTDCIIVNQGDKEEEYTYEYKNRTIYVIESTTRGLSRSRNLAKKLALKLDYEVLVFADDDVQYCSEFLEIVLESYRRTPSADLIAFDIIRLNYLGNTENVQDCPIPSYDIMPSNRKHEYFGSVRISVKKDFLTKNDFEFKEFFGAGSNEYTHGEDSLFLKECKDAGANVFKSKDIIAKVDFSESTWRNVPFSKICFDKGALWKALSSKLYWLYGFILIKRMTKEENEKFWINYKSFLYGAKDYKRKY